MKAIKTLLLFGFSVLLISSCFNPPEFPVTPEIEFEDIYFKEIGNNSTPDSLVLTISFKDGDGDLGLGDNDVDDPFHEQDFFLDENNNNKLLRLRSRKIPGNEDLPPFEKPYNCLNYTYDTLYVPESQKSVFDETYNQVRKFVSGGTTYYALLDTFYVEKNPNHYNITVEFLQKQGSGFETFEWRTVYPYPTCGETFDGRFPVLSEQGKTSALEGKLRYAMKSNGFLPFFSAKTLKLRVQIKDRALHSSNIIETPEFTLR
jgi:hypothetical protein